MSRNGDFNLDSIISRLLRVRTESTKVAKIKESEIRTLLKLTKKVLMSQPVLLELQTPVRICGDIHGQYDDLLRIFDYTGYPPNQNFLFLGDYVDRGKRGLEVICLLFAYKVKYSENFFLLRGNHETDTVNKLYGFYEEIQRRYSIKLWKMFNEVFRYLPMAAILDDCIFCVHGGLSPELKSVDQIYDIQRPFKIPEYGLVCDLVWSDPSDDVEKFGPSDRGISYFFGRKPVDKFLRVNEFDLIVRAHQIVMRGYEFFNDKKLVTIFSAPNYCGEFENSAAIMNVNQDLNCSFKVLEPQPSSIDVPEKGTNSLPPTPIKKRGGSYLY